ncbi:uncharacterized protein LOC129227305 [Uloborus diversus]|uniref:uncharacterized protein LOC129227305 n=1 Tax=Uloborus diversus TaxID=327109 RepID=UPI002409369D|nr:uncharacterized protein LOC129227305 [Uloborus diversus]XP_054717821.1 uncharacterized protein LOC129227305 [Uloborus diversus]XP_054717822.1 uncharacterized protein LOC129227305 [Uloborus diversus]
MLRKCHPCRSCRGVCLLLLTFTILPFLILLRRPAVPIYVLQHPYFSYDLDSEEVPDSKQKCSLPRVHPFHPSVWEYISPPKPLVCSSRRGDWTYVDRQGRLKFNVSAVADSGYVVGSSLNCYWSAIFRAKNEESDLKVVYGKEIPLPEEGLTLPTSVEIVKVVCRNFASFEIYENVHAHIRNVTLSSPSSLQHPVNVLIFGIDSLSRTAFIRLLPNTYRYLTEVLNMTVFRGMNKVGDNTYPNLIALLTGDKAYGGSLPDYTDGFDAFPLIWKNYSSAGYATMFAEDFPDFGLFTYLATGFRKVPTHHYLRPFWLAVKESPLLKLSSHLCYGPTPLHWLQVDYVNKFVSRYEDRKVPYFGFSFLAELSHEYISPIASADDYFMKFFKSLSDRGYLKNTVFIVMSDHGHRFDPIRKTEVGYIEERMPFLSIHVPETITFVQKTAKESLQKNSGRLVTPFDLHATLLDLLAFVSSGQPLGQHAPKNTLGLSLFGGIPADRNCEDAKIPVHYCVCEKKTDIPLSDFRSVSAAQSIVDHVNSLIAEAGKEFSDRCAVLSVGKVTMAHLIEQMEDLPQNEAQKIRVVVEAEPSGALLEATVLHQEGKIEIINEVSRLNPYADQSGCIKHVILRKYCFCSTDEKAFRGDDVIFE